MCSQLQGGGVYVGGGAVTFTGVSIYNNQAISVSLWHEAIQSIPWESIVLTDIYAWLVCVSQGVS